MTQTLESPASSVNPPSNEAYIRPVNLELALLKTVVSFWCAIRKGDVIVGGMDASDALRRVERICKSAEWLVDRMTFSSVDAVSRRAPKDIQDMASAHVRAENDSGAPWQVVSQSFDEAGAAATFDSSRLLECEVSACAKNMGDRRRFAETPPEITDEDWGLVGGAVLYRAIRGARPNDRQEAFYLARYMQDMGVGGMDQVPRPTADCYRVRLTPQPISMDALDIVQ